MARRVLASISRKRTGFPWDSTRCFVGLFAIPADRNRISGKCVGKVSLISPLGPVTTERVQQSRDDLGRRPVQRLAPLLAPAAWRRLHADCLGGTGYHVAKASCCPLKLRAINLLPLAVSQSVALALYHGLIPTVMDDGN